MAKKTKRAGTNKVTLNISLTNQQVGVLGTVLTGAATVQGGQTTGTAPTGGTRQPGAATPGASPGQPASPASAFQQLIQTLQQQQGGAGGVPGTGGRSGVGGLLNGNMVKRNVQRTATLFQMAGTAMSPMAAPTSGLGVASSLLQNVGGGMATGAFVGGPVGAAIGGAIGAVNTATEHAMVEQQYQSKMFNAASPDKTMEMRQVERTVAIADKSGVLAAGSQWLGGPDASIGDNLASNALHYYASIGAADAAPVEGVAPLVLTKQQALDQAEAIAKAKGPAMAAREFVKGLYQTQFDAGMQMSEDDLRPALQAAQAMFTNRRTHNQLINSMLIEGKTDGEGAK